MKTIPFACTLCFCALAAQARPALALQSLDEFVAGARTTHPQNHEAQALRVRAEAQASEATARALPGLGAAATYTRNEWEVSFGNLEVVPRDQLDASITLAVPLVDLAKFARISAADGTAAAAAQQEEATQREVQAQVVQLYYRLAAGLALVAVARQALAVVEVDLQLTEAAARAGSAAALDVARAQAEVEQRRQQLTGADLQVKLTAQTLASATGLRPDIESPPDLADDLHTEPPVAQFLATVGDTPAVLAATGSRDAAERNATAQRLTLLPALNGAVVERYTNATGFLNGHHTAYAATLSLSWTLDLGTSPAMRARTAEALAAAAHQEAVHLAVTDAVMRAYRTIEADIDRSRSARAQAAATARAAELARTRYRAGVVTQLEMIQADRDAFTAEAARIQSDGDLLNARRQLRLAAAGRTAP